MTTADAGPRDASAATGLEASPSASVPEEPRPAGANGPVDARGMVGEIGGGLGDQSATAFLDMAALRAHPKGVDIARLVVATFPAWRELVPYDVVHPLREAQWIVVTSEAERASARPAAVLARVDVPAPRADVLATLAKRLPADRIDPKVYGVPAIEAKGAEPRVYLRPHPHVLAIVPKAEAARVAALLAKAASPETPRHGELLRIAVKDVPPLVGRYLSIQGPLRIWVAAEGADPILYAETDATSEVDASRLAGEIRKRLDDVHGIPAFVARNLLAGAKVVADGRTVRYRATLDDGLVGLATMSVCDRDATCGIPK